MIQPKLQASFCTPQTFDLQKQSKTFMFYLTVILLSAVCVKLRCKMVFRSLLHTVTEEDLKPSHKTKPQQL